MKRSKKTEKTEKMSKLCWWTGKHTVVERVYQCVDNDPIDTSWKQCAKFTNQFGIGSNDKYFKRHFTVKCKSCNKKYSANEFKIIVSS